MGKEILIIGIGGSGCSIADKLTRRLCASGRGDKVSALAFDTDAAALASFCHVTAFPMVDDASLGGVVERLGQERLSRYFPCDWVNDHTGFLKTLEMNRGAGQWRAKSLLALVNFLSVTNARERLLEELRPFAESDGNFTIFVIASLAGGTGSGLLLPLTLYLRGLLGGRGRAVAMLACPDIYDGLVSAEQRVKMAANAYATLRELNAVDMTIRDGRPAAQKTSHPYATVCLDDGMQMGRLLDTVSKDAPVIPPAPFDRVFLQDKLPCVTSVGTHEDVMASLLYPICCDIHGETHAVDLTAPAPANIWGGLSTLEIRYPREAMVRYIKTKNIFDTARNEWLPLIERAEDATLTRAAQERAYGGYLADVTATFAEQMCRVVNTYINEEKMLIEDDETVLPRTLEALGEEVDGSTIVPLDDLMEAYFPSEAARDLRDLITQCGKVTPDETKNPFEKQAKMRESARQLRQIATDAWKLVNDYYTDAIRVLREEKKSFAERVMAKDGYLMSLYRSFDHPALGLYALCALHVALASRCSGVFELTHLMLTDEEFDTLPKEMQELAQVRVERCKYGKNNRLRFYELASSTGRTTIGAGALDRELLCEDMTAMLHGVTAFVTDQLNLILLDQLSNVIDRLRQAMLSVGRRMDDMAQEVRLALNAGCSESNLAVNVGASPAQKETVQASYWKHHYLADDEERLLSGKLTAAFAELACNEEHIPGGVTAALERIMSDYEELVKEHLAPRDTDPTALELMLAEGVVGGDTDGVVTHDGEAMARRALRLAPAPLHLRASEPTETEKGIRIVSILQVSERTAAYALRHAERWDLPRATAAEAIQNLVYMLGEYETNVIVCPELDDDRMIVCRAVQDLPLYMVTPFNEMDRDGIYYRSYRKALMMMTRQMTQMWNPHLCRGMERHGALAYIHPEMQKKRENLVAKALVYALMKGELFFAAEQTNEAIVYHFADDGVIQPILVDDEPVLADDTARLLVWMRSDESRMEQWSESYDRLLEQTCRSLPAIGLGSTALMALEDAIAESLLVGTLRENVFRQNFPPENAPVMGIIELAWALRQAEGENDSGDALRLLELGYDMLRTLCSYRTAGTGTAKDVENYITVYSSQLRAIMEALLQRCPDRETAENMIRWANGYGLFLRYRTLASQCPYLDDAT